MKSPLISFVTHGRNDGFMGDFLWRVSTCINQIARNYAALGRSDDIEILIGDWGSEQATLRDAMQLEPAARRVTRFCTVPPAVAARLNRDGDYAYSPAANIPIRRATGKFIFSMDSDAWMPLKTAEYLLQIADGKYPAGLDLDKSFFWASRQHIPYSFISTSPSIEALDRYLVEERDKPFWTGKCNMKEFRGGAVAIFGKREHFFAIRGYNEALVHWGWHDIDIHYRMAMTFTPHDLWDLGAEMFHMEHYPKRGGAVAGGRKMTPQIFPTMQTVNGPEWGAINDPVEVAPAPEPLPAVKKSSSRPLNLVISGTNFWNPGDDFVRDGIIRVLREVFPGEVLNFLFYNFNADFFPQSKFAGIGNNIAKGDLEKYRDHVDAVIIAGLSAGDEIKDLYRWIVASGLEKKTYLIGAGYENSYVKEHVSQQPEATIFRNARVITGRTAKTPDFIKAAGIPYHHINCPAILSVPEVKPVPAGKKIERIGFSIQLPPGDCAPNHSCDAKQYELAVSVLRDLARDYAVEVVAHHKTEYFHFLNLLRGENIPVIFSSFYQDLHQVYPRYDLLITTRLHASLFANGHGIPGIILNDTDRHTHTLEGFSHSIWVNNRESFDQAFSRWTRADLGTVARELRDFKAQLLGKYATVLRPILAGDSIRSNEQTSLPASSPRGGESLGVRTLPVHFFTIVLNGQPFIRHHINEFKRLPFQWHWHIVEGVAELNHDTGWSKAAGGKIPNELHRDGLSMDGTTEYLDALQKEFPENVTIYRPPAGKFWDGKREMVIAPLANISEACLLWQVDADELWTYSQIIRARAMFLMRPEKTAALFHCHFFVGPELVVTSRGTYGNNAADAWLRLWRHQPGDRWIAHEPPQLCRGALDVASINPFRHAETEAMGLVFQHYAYAIEAQLRFKESYYGYAGAVNQWRKLQQAENFPQRLGNHFGWVNDEALVNRIQAAGVKRLVPDQWLGISGVNRVQMPAETGRTIAARNADQPALKKAMKVAEDYAHEKDLTKIDGDSQFARAIRNLFKIYQPRRIIETGTYFGTGTTRVITETLRDLGFAGTVFHSIEINPGHFTQARANLHAAGLASFVDLQLGLSVPRQMLPTVAQIEESTVKQPEYDGIFVDHREAQRAKLYFAETNFDDCADDLLGRALAGFNHCPDFVLLDSGGHMGFVEFQYLIQKLAGPCLIALDDIHHIKHHKSFQFMRRDSRFEMLLESQEKFGFCIARFTPAVKATTEVNRIVWVRTDSIGDAVLASSMLEPLRQKHPQAKLAVLCQHHVANLYMACPFVDAIICYDVKKIFEPAERQQIVDEITAFNPDVILNSVRSRDKLSEELTLAFANARHIAIEGDLDNISEEDSASARARYENIVSTPDTHQPELARHADFLRGLGIEAAQLSPVVWTSAEDEALAEAFFRQQELKPARTIAVFPGAQYQMRVYTRYAEALKKLDGFRFLIFGDTTQNQLAEELEQQLPGRIINLCGRSTLRETAALLRRCRLYVGAESAGAHMACALGIPNVVMLGGGHFGRFMPYSPLTSAVMLPMDCFGCNWRCKYDTAHCIASVDPKVLDAAIADALNGPRQKPAIFALTNGNGAAAATLPPALAAKVAPGTVDYVPVPAPALEPSWQFGQGTNWNQPNSGGLKFAPCDVASV